MTIQEGHLDTRLSVRVRHMYVSTANRVCKKQPYLTVRSGKSNVQLTVYRRVLLHLYFVRRTHLYQRILHGTYLHCAASFSFWSDLNGSIDVSIVTSLHCSSLPIAFVADKLTQHISLSKHTCLCVCMLKLSLVLLVCMCYSTNLLYPRFTIRAWPGPTSYTIADWQR